MEWSEACGVGCGVAWTIAVECGQAVDWIGLDFFQTAWSM